MKKIWLLAALAAAFAAGAANAAGPELITNGSFEAQTITGTQTDNNGFVTDYQYLNTPVGSKYFNSGVLSSWNVQRVSGSRGVLLFNGNYQPVANGINALQFETVGDSISQTFATVIGQQYQLTYALSANGAAGALAVSVGDGSWTDSIGSTGAIPQLLSHSFMATDTSSTILLRSMNSYPQFDNISVTAITAAVPEPESYAMLMAGLGVVGALARRRRRQA